MSRLNSKIFEYLKNHQKIDIKPHSIRCIISQIRTKNPGLTLNAAAQVFADNRGISVMRYLSDEDRKSLQLFKKAPPSSITISKNKKVQVKKVTTTYGKTFLQDGNKNADIYPYVYILENSLRKVILDVFENDKDWWNKKVSTGVKEYADRIKQSEKKNDWLPRRANHPIYYVGLNELYKIISKNYSSHFKHIFTDQGNLRTWINECIPIRNLLAHNVKVNHEERQNLIIRTKYICTLIEKYHKKS